MQAIDAATHPDDFYASEGERGCSSNTMTVEITEYNKLMQVACAVHGLLHNDGDVADLARAYEEYSALCGVGEKTMGQIGKEKQDATRRKAELAKAVARLEKESARAKTSTLTVYINAVVRAAKTVLL